jgi:hypothetical protein
MSSSIVSKTDSNSESSSYFDENTVRQAMHKLFSHNNNDPSSPGDDSISSLQSFKTNHAKFTSNSVLFQFSLCNLFFIGELLLEWLTLNCDTRNSNTQALIEQVESCLHSNTNTNSNENDLRKVN